MKIDRTKLKKSSSEVPVDCKALIDLLKGCKNKEDLLTELSKIKTWTYGKCELYHWADVLDICDEVLEKACARAEGRWTLPCDLPDNAKDKELLLQVLSFTALLIEHSFTRHLYNSMEHLTMLLASSDMTVVLAVLNLLYVFSKRSNFITRLNAEKKQGLVLRLTHLAENWGGKESGFGLAECCQDLPMSTYPTSATTLHFEFYAENKENKSSKKTSPSCLCSIRLENVDQKQQLASEIMENLIDHYSVPQDKQMLLFTHIRLAQAFSKYEKRIQCVQARLQAISILVYSNAIQENVNSLLYTGLIEELVDILEVKDEKLLDIKAAALRTLTSIIHLERTPRLNNIIDATGAASYHGFLPVLVRTCIQHMTEPDLTPFPQPFATALFSFLYHLASYESGGEALVSCGMMESLLKVINWYGEGHEHITVSTQFVTRAVRVIDLITNLDMAAFQSHAGLSAFINRLEHEVDVCRKEQPFVIRPRRSESSISIEQPQSPLQLDSIPMETDSTGAGATTTAGASSSAEPPPLLQPATKTEDGKALQCFPQRAALLKSMLNFLKKAIPDPAFSESIRHLMDGSLPRSLKHIISNAEYYGPSLFLLATDVVTVYVFQEPSLLSSLQDNGLTDVVLHALLVKDVPATREVLASLPNVFSALCLNTRGLEAFVQCKPFDRLFKVLLSPDYLPAMRRRRSSDPLGDTANNLGNAMDELMRHQPSLRTDATKAIIKLLEEVCAMGRDATYICQKPQPKSEQSPGITLRSSLNPEPSSSDDEDEDDEVGSTHSSSMAKQPDATTQQDAQSSSSTQERTPIPLMDYVLNVMKFVEAILSNNTTDDHCLEFVTQKGLVPLMGIFGLPNLPIDFPASPSCQAVASVCKSILTLSHEPQVLKQGLLHLNEVLTSLDPLHRFLPPPGGSVLLHELATAPNSGDATLSSQATPLLHALAAAHAYITMFTHVCKVGQSHIRTISINHWGSELGLQVLEGLSKLYTSLVWESTVLLAFCSEDILPLNSEFGRADLERLIPKDLRDKEKTKDADGNLMRATGEMGSNGVSAAMESLSTSESAPSPMETDEVGVDVNDRKNKVSPVLQAQIKQIKPLLSASSRLGRALAELFGLLVKLCVGLPVRQRRSQHHMPPPQPQNPSPPAHAVATALTKLVASGLRWDAPPSSPVPKLRLTFFICSVGFTSPMLFDEKKFPYHLMLQKFISSGGQDALFEAFNWAVSCGGSVPIEDGLEHPTLPDGTGEFLVAWLMLVEKMVNPDPLFSPTYSYTNFRQLEYMKKTHKAAFHAVMKLWNKKPLKVYGGRMSESILAILCHIIKGEATLKYLLSNQPSANGTPGTSSSSSNGAGVSSALGGALGVPGPSSSSGLPSMSGSFLAPPFTPPPDAIIQQPTINQEYLQALMDMGFSREHCQEALTHTNSIEQATEWILTHPPPAAPAAANEAGSGGNAGNSSNNQADLDMSEEAQMMRAIAMSLGENVVVSTDEGAAAAKKKEEEEEEKKKKAEAEALNDVIEDEEPLPKETIDEFTNNMMQGCMQLLDTLPETVYRVCDLIVVVTTRNGDKWRDDILAALVAEISELSLHLIDAGRPMTTSDTRSMLDWANQLSSMTEGAKLAVRLHLLTLLLELPIQEMRLSSAQAMHNSNVVELMVQLLDTLANCLVAHKDAATPKWVAPLLLLLDLYEKVSTASKRRAQLNKLVGKNRVWKCFDDRTARWTEYNVTNNKAIDAAYQKGEGAVRIMTGRRWYNIQFSSMVQINEETGNRRPIMLALPGREDKSKKEDKKEKKEEKNKSKDSDSKESSSTESEMETEDSPKEIETVVVDGISRDQATSVIRGLVHLISLPVDPDSLHAVLRLALRLTRDHSNAIQFAELGGPRHLLVLTQASGFQGFTALATLLLRHILEEPTTLKNTMEKVVRSASQGAGSGMNTAVTQGANGLKEVNYVLRVLGPAACRNPELFAEVSRNTLRIALTRPLKREDEARLTSPNTPQILKCMASKSSAPQSSFEGPIREVLYDLLNALAAKYTADAEEKQVAPGTPFEETLQEVMIANHLAAANGSADQPIHRQGSTADLQQEEQNALAASALASAGSSSDTKPGSTDDSPTDDTKAKEVKNTEEEKRKRPLLPKSAIMRLLAELVRSYTGVAAMITGHNYYAGQTELVTEDCNVLAFILDHLLAQCQTSGDKDCPPLARVLLASLASCTHSPEAQGCLATELKGALQRAMALPENTDKHSRLQALTSMISTVIDACPTPGQVPNQLFKRQQSAMNNMVRLLLKRGLVTDLARLPHSLDLASPSMATTINQALKPLETLSRIVNQPQTVVNKQRPRLENETQCLVVEPTQDNANTESSTQNTDSEPVTQSASAVTIEDVTEDVEDHADLEETGPLDPEEPEDPPVPATDIPAAVEVGLEQVLDTLLGRDETGRTAPEEILGEIIMDGDDAPRRSQREEESQDVLIDVEVETEDLDQHDSQMVSQMMSDEEVGDDELAPPQAQGEDEDSGSDADDCDDCEVVEGEEEGEDDDDEDDDDDDDEEDEGSDMEADNDDLPDIDESLYRLPDDSDLYVHLEDVLPSGGPHFLLEDRGPLRSYNLPTANHNNDNVTQSVPPAPSTVTSTHPLLMRQSESHSLSSNLASRVHRTGRQRGSCRYNPNTQTLHVHYTSAGRHPNPPAILQRLLGPSAAADVLQLTNTLSAGGGGQARFHLVTDNDIRVMTRDEDMFDDLFQDTCMDSTGGGSGVLSSVPSALCRWTEEARVLDADSMHDCVTVLKPDIISELESQRDKELAEWREQRRKQQEEEATKKAATAAEAATKESEGPGSSVDKVEADVVATSSSSATESSQEGATETSTPQNMEVEGSRTTPSTTESTTSSDVTTSEPSTTSANIPGALTVTSAVPQSAPSLPVFGGATPVPATQPIQQSALSSALESLMQPSATPVVPSTPATAGVQLSLETPNQPIPLTTPAAPRHGRHPTMPIFADLQTDRPPAPEPLPASAEVYLPPTTTASADLPPLPVPEIPLPPGEGPGSQSGAAVRPTEGITATSSGNVSEAQSSSSGTPSDQPASATDTASGATADTTPGSSGSTANTPGQSSNMFGDIPLPEGVDPSFLEALPDNIRQEVIAEQIRLQRIQQRARQLAQQAEALSSNEVSAEFLAALPPNIQEEVLAQQRAEQARLQASTNPPIAPDAPVDPAGFISSLPTSLRQQVLADMDDSLVAVLPADLAAEAQGLRRELEERHRRLMHDRLFQGAASLSAILRQSGYSPGLAGRLGTARYALRQQSRGGSSWWSTNPSSAANQGVSSANTVRLRGRHLLDHEALTCLLVLLFVDEPKLNTSRLHRVLRNLCYHAHTRAWVIASLLSILQRTSEQRADDEPRPSSSGKASDKFKRKSSNNTSDSSRSTPATPPVVEGRSTVPSWLAISMDAALGCRANVFQIHKSSKKSGMSGQVSVHAQVAPLICLHVLDTLISLAKSFPCQFLPPAKAKEASCETKEKGKDSAANSTQTSPARTPRAAESRTDNRTDTDFWDILVKLDSAGVGGRKGKSVTRVHSSGSVEGESTCTNFETSPLGQLMAMLAHPVVRRSQLLTDRLLRLLGLVSVGLPNMTATPRATSMPVCILTTSTTPTPSNAIAPTDGAAVTQSSEASQPTAATDSQSSGTVSQAEQDNQVNDSLNETMDVTMQSVRATSTPVAKPPENATDAEKAKASETKEVETEDEDPVLENQLQLAVEVLTSKSCSEEGLEDATNLLLQLSRANNATRDMVLQLLLGGARTLGMTVCQHIRELLNDLLKLTSHLKEQPEVPDDNGDDTLAQTAAPKGILQDRFGTGQAVVVHAPNKVKTGGRELQVPSMSLLTNKNASQHFLLRILKVIIQLRDAARVSAKKQRQSELVSQQEASRTSSESQPVSLLEPAGAPTTSSTEAVAGSNVTSGQEESAPASAGNSSSAEASNNQGPSSEGTPVDRDIPMEVDVPVIGSSDSSAEKKDDSYALPRLSDQLLLEELWDMLGECLTELARTSDHHAVLVLQPAVEAFFLVHAGEKESSKRDSAALRREDQLAHLNLDVQAPASPAAPSIQEETGTSAGGSGAGLTREDSVMSVSSVISSKLPPDTQKFLRFAETHRTVLNQILRQSSTPLAEGPFSVLVEHTRVLDFDVKRRYFRQELERRDEGLRREDLAVHVRREHVFEDSYRELHRRSVDEWKHRFYIVFEGEEGQDAGGLLREWYLIISREIFNPMYALFATSPGDRVTYTINPSSHCNSNHLSYFKFVGRIIAKAIYDNKLLECYFTRSFYKHILGVLVKYTDMESEDYSFYQGLVFLMENHINDLGYELTFSTEIQEFGVTQSRDLKPNGRNIVVTEELKKEYVKLVCQMKMTGAIRKQLNAFLEGFYDIIPKRLISIFNEQELELLISGLPTVDIDDLKSNSEYHKYQPNSLQIQWFWRALRSFDQANRALFLQFVTGTSKVPLQGFAHLEGMNGTQKFQIHRDDRSTDRLPCAHTCFNQLDLPAYETYDKLRTMLELAINECSGGFGLA